MPCFVFIKDANGGFRYQMANQWYYNLLQYTDQFYRKDRLRTTPAFTSWLIVLGGLRNICRSLCPGVE